MTSSITSVQEVLRDMVSKLPKDVFEKSTTRATRRLIASVGLVTLGVVLVYNLPWYLLPIGWFFMGTACCGIFSVGYACGKNLFFKNRAINYTVGTILMLPLMYPLEYWKRSEVHDTIVDYVRDVSRTPYWWLCSLRQWAVSTVSSLDSGRMIVSAGVLYAFVAIFVPLMTYGFGLWGLFKFYLIPLFIYHLWMSTFMKASYLSFEQGDNPTFFRLPRFVQYLTQDFNIGVILTRIHNQTNSVIPIPPAYKWKEAYQVLKKEYEGITEETFFDVLQKVGPSVKKSLQTIKSDVATTEQPPKQKSKFDGKPWYERIFWTTTIFLFATPALSIYGMATTPFNWRTYLTAFLSYYIAGIGITAGYHRLFSHRSYDASWPVRVVLTLMGTTAFEMSVIEWCHDHRAHHRYTDTDKDPYNVKRGFWWAHMGWLIFKRETEPEADVEDLKKDWVLRLQHKYYAPLAIGLGFLLPMWICGHFWGDWKGGFLIAGIASKVLMMQCTFCINSLAHYIGEATYTDQRSPRDSPITSLVTFGEGYHNFHHEFPYDYRNGIHASAYDPGKWLICFLSWFGLTYNLKRFPAELFQKGKIQMAEKKAAEERKKLFWGKPLEELPEMTRIQVRDECNKSGQRLIILNDVVYDVSEFEAKHPGGVQYIKDYIGKDATKAFEGVVYNHSFAARNILDTLRVAKLSTIDKKQE
uniref:Delta 9 fatty acid desaturase ScdA n=1 Tax=Cavenderia deminutiva TaxID=361123 RepID=A0A1L2FV52_9MYCE|nr:delta 9 fatty acid desaturase ScdA [Cavenderia deminutiva]